MISQELCGVFVYSTVIMKIYNIVTDKKGLSGLAGKGMI